MNLSSNKNLFLILLLTAFQFASAQTKNAFSQQEVSDFLKTLTADDMQGRETGKPGLDKAALFLEKFFAKNKIKPYFKTYKDTLSNFDAPAYNIVGVLEGNDPKLKNEFIIISGHYDHIGMDTSNPTDQVFNGANDDASGVTATAFIAKHFAKTKSNKRSILFVFFAGEEKGLLGSTHLAKKLAQNNFNLYAHLNIEMIGVPMKKDFTTYITGFKMSNFADVINKYAKPNTVGFLPAETEYQLFYRSDNLPFYETFKKPCQTICTFDFENYNYYHDLKDEFEQMDIPHIHNVISSLIPAIEKISANPTQEIQLYDSN